MGIGRNEGRHMNEQYVDWFALHINVVVLLAGRGSRFADYSTLPKPMIPTGNGQTILERTLASLPWLNSVPRSHLWFVVLEEHVLSHHIDEWLQQRYGRDANVLILKHATRGNLVTARIAVDHIIKNGDAREGSPRQYPLLILDGDNAYDGSEIHHTFVRMDEVDNFANVYYFKQENPDSHWCFVKVDDTGRVVSLKEKEIIRDGYPMIGVFYFRALDTFAVAAREVLKAGATSNNEFYMSQAVRLLVDRGDALPVFGFEVKDVVPLGTPEDVVRANAIVPKPAIRQLRIAIDIDDTINHCKEPGDTYGHETIQPRALDVIRTWKAQGHYIILNTARNMRTCDGNMGKILAREGLTLLQWLKDNNVPYDEIWWTKPHADLFIDDKAIQHHVDQWDETERQVARFLEEHP